MSQINNIYQNIKDFLDHNKSIATQIHNQLNQCVSQIYSHALQSDESYCYKFNVPITIVMNFYKMLNLNADDVQKAFQKDWNYPSNATMYRDPYYHILFLLMYYAIHARNDVMRDNAFFLILIKIWNGRKALFFRYCDKKIMKYVISHMLNNKHLASKYDTPLQLLKDYFVPTLLEKYTPVFINNPVEMKRLFMQSFARIYQIFAQNMKKNLQTGKNEAQGGLLPLYLKARDQGLYMSSETLTKGNEAAEETPGFDEYSTIHNREVIANAVTDYITMNIKPQYPETFINAINNYTHVSTKNIINILGELHNHKYHDLIYDIIILILSQTGVTDKMDICKTEFFGDVKRNVISSKNNESSRKLKLLLNTLLIDILKGFNLDFEKYSNTNQVQIRNVVIYGLVYNMKKAVCQVTSVNL